MSCFPHERNNHRVFKRNSLLCRLDRHRRPSPPQSFYHRKRRSSTRSNSESYLLKTPAEDTVGAILRALQTRRPTDDTTAKAARTIITFAGTKRPHELSAADAYEIDAAICESGYAHSTRLNRATNVRRLLRWLKDHHGAPDLTNLITRHPGLRPRNVTATDTERAAILAAAPPDIRLWLLLCSDLAMRSGTAQRITSDEYDASREEIRFITKLGEHLTLPVTAEIADAFALCDAASTVPFVRQTQIAQQQASFKNRQQAGRPINPTATRTAINVRYRRLLDRIGIMRKLTPHDFRRTTATRLYEKTGDARDVQALLGHRSLASTIWYLDHDMRPVSRTMLELLKQPQERRIA